MRKKIIKRIAFVILLIPLVIGGYFLIPYIIDLIARPYNLRTYKNRLARKEKQHSVTYYLSQNGDDKKDGKTKSAAWKSVQKINGTEFNPGDSILLEGGKIFTGNIVFDEHDMGTSKKPVFIGSYGGGKAIIDAGQGTGIEVLNSAGFHVSNLIIKGSRPDKNEGSGVAFINNLRGEIKLDFIQIDSVEASGFGWWGILIDGNRKKSGFRNVSIESCSVYDNGDAGLYVYGEYNYVSKAYAHENVFIRNVKAYNNKGRPDSYENTGSGIVLSDTDNGLIEKCVAYENGALCHSTLGGPVGIWAWDSKDVVIQYNESFNNKTGAAKDGGGFDLDGAMLNSILQYNYSHDNDGSGFFLAQFTYARRHSGNIIRYNISENDGRKNGYAGIDIWGAVENAYVYNNSVLISPALKDTPTALFIRPNLELSDPKFPQNIIIANNIFSASGNVKLIKSIKEIASVKLLNNNYYNDGFNSIFNWGGQTFSSFEAWRAATPQGKEAASLYGFSIDPQWGSPISKGSAVQTSRTMPYLNPGSPMIDRGINVQEVYKIKGVEKDINGVKIPQQSGFDLGACEFIKQ
jgi:hypothetical protein